MSSMFALPNELVLSTISSAFPGRERQIRTLATLLSISASPCRNVVVYGLEATGKSSITKAVLEAAAQSSEQSEAGRLQYAIIKSAECITGRHLLEQTIGAIARATRWKGPVPRCENLAQLAFGIGHILEDWLHSRRFVIVFDGIDHQREAPATLLPALARLGETIPNLSTVFLMTAPRPGFFHIAGIPHVHFPPYTKVELLKILSLMEPVPALPGGLEETEIVWNHFCSAVWDSLAKHSGRDILSFRAVCTRLWPSFVQPVLNGTCTSTPFSRLLVVNRALFQNDGLLVPSIVDTPTQVKQGIGQLPYFSRLLLVAAYLASYNPPRTDQTYFMKSAAAKRRKKGGGTALTGGRTSKHRKISRKLLGPQAFVLERLLAIFQAIKLDANGRISKTGGDADVQMAIATLSSLRLLVKMGSTNAGDALEGGKWKIAVGWEVIRTVARSVGLEAEDYLAD